MGLGIVVPLLAGGIALGFGVRALRRRRRLQAVRETVFPPSVARTVGRRWPQLTPAQLDRVLAGLRSYLEICAVARLRTVAMPSKAIDEAWHQFILSTRNYEDFCQRAFGRYLHHAPDADMPVARPSAVGVRRCWRIACALEGIDPRQPHRLPLVFALDAELGIPDGYRFPLDCRRQAPADGTAVPVPGYCATELACSGSGCSAGGTFACAGGSDGAAGHVGHGGDGGHGGADGGGGSDGGGGGSDGGGDGGGGCGGGGGGGD